MSESSGDRAGLEYWDELWQVSGLPSIIDPRDARPGNAANRRFHALFQKVFEGLSTAGGRLVEVGCARSAWLPYFAREHGFAVSGLDYSELGCRQERELLARAGLVGEIVCADMFDPPSELRGRFDVAVSFGVVEHFADTPAAVRAQASLVRPGGLVITIVPNMLGAIGRIEQLINPDVYAIHVPVSPSRLGAAHRVIGLDVLRAEHFLSTGFGILNLNGLDPDGPGTRAKAVARAQLSRLSKVTWAFEDRFRPLPTSRALSPYVVCVARRPGRRDAPLG